MWKIKLRIPLSTIFRRVLPINSSCLSVNYIPQNRFFTANLSSSQLVVGESRVLRTPTRCYFLGKHHFCRTNLCSESAEKFRCWNCNAEAGMTPFLFCNSCRSVQPVDHSVDYFQIFGLTTVLNANREKKYEIEDENLEGKYKDWQKKLHPDLVHSKSKQEREYAAEQSARVIDAYRTLTNPLSRAIYILKLEGVDVDEEERISDPDLLAEIMEIREAVEEAQETQALNQIQAQIQEKLTRWRKSFANAFQSRKYEEAQTSIRRMTYYIRANEEIVKKL
ncbi:unnamed protein product [Ilex paraguariensis]|uniref:J domain-containing protein n=1 Tax=Ilex paraguariensis TaxID=185542 RepID=A0ABC8SUH3_9AQUA